MPRIHAVNLTPGTVRGMNTQAIRDTLEQRQIVIYFATVAIAAAVAYLVPGAASLEPAINPALALMLFVTFLQVPLA